MTDSGRTEPVRTVAGRGRARFAVRGSTFVGHAAPARSVDATESVIARLCGEYADATHNVPAYRVRSATSGRARLAGEFDS